MRSSETRRTVSGGVTSAPDCSPEPGYSPEPHRLSAGEVDGRRTAEPTPARASRSSSCAPCASDLNLATSARRALPSARSVAISAASVGCALAESCLPMKAPCPDLKPPPPTCLLGPPRYVSSSADCVRQSVCCSRATSSRIRAAASSTGSSSVRPAPSASARPSVPIPSVVAPRGMRGGQFDLPPAATPGLSAVAGRPPKVRDLVSSDACGSRTGARPGIGPTGSP
ncbi:hypothetical protein T492DRAFT_969869 [Pavlovales sp. CCMP2436]|nr:hypothetical protein T492DRAFT_969869 [Pavlovales sp. CCMP2436]